MNNQENQKHDWIGKKGFDEAYYYDDIKSDMGFTHSDETIYERVKEALNRRGCESSGFTIEVSSGVVTLKGPFIFLGKAAGIIRGLSGVKAVRTVEEEN
jgi:osmotically-inducible protein OsmY